MDRCWAKRAGVDGSRCFRWLLGLTLGVAWPSVAAVADDVSPPARARPSAAATAADSQVQGATPPAPAATLSAQDALPRPHAQPPLPAGPSLHVDKRSLDMLKTTAPAPIEAGVISRAELRAELGRGVAQFLRQVRPRPVIERGRFVGWRLLALFPERPDIHVKALRAGDTVQRVNGRSLERPEEFQAVWDSLAQADELVIELRRDAQSTKLRYAISP